MVEPNLDDLFPGLRGQQFQIQSPKNYRYNCVAFAAGDASNWWWPNSRDDEDTWPAGVDREETLDAFQAAFATLGYVPSDDDRLEPGFEKVAIFARAGVPKHAARQLKDGRWISKLGAMEDIEHALHDLTGASYGAVALVMKRPRAADVTSLAATPG